MDVEPVADVLKSRCLSFAEAAGDGTWLLGFLVYDRQPGQMHYYSLRRLHMGMWIQLDSQGHRNCMLRESELWELYAASRMLFQCPEMAGRGL